MTIEEAQSRLKEKYGVEVEILKDGIFIGHTIVFHYLGYVREEQRRKEAKFYEVDLENLEEWIEKNDRDIKSKLSII